MTETEDEKPPLFASWKGWYAALAAALVLQIIIYYLITIRFT